MDTKIIPLGTASAVPTRDRHLSAAALQRGGSLLLFDCGEGTQLQLIQANLKRSRIEAVFITHFHGDHFYGLMGLLSTLALLQRTAPLTVVGPEGLASIVRSLPGLDDDWLSYPVVYVELAEDFEHEVVLDTPDYFVEARPIEHRVFAAGFRYQEKARPGRLDVDRARALGITDYAHYRRLKAGEPVVLEDGRRIQPEEVVGPEQPGASFAYVFDTRPCEAAVLLARDVDLVYHEATFTEEKREQAVKTGHSTAHEAACVARAAGAKRLLLGHFSARYTDPAPLVEEARSVFKNTDAAEELKRYVLAPGKEVPEAERAERPSYGP